MTEIVDRRKTTDSDSIVSRQRFLSRNKGHIKEAVEKAISDGKIGDLGKGGVDVSVPKGSINEPTIHHGEGGARERVYPWNKQFQKGDEIPKPQGGGGGRGGQPSKDGEGEDDFVFHINEDEFLNYVFDDLELPDLVKTNQERVVEVQFKNAGFVNSGTPSRLSMEESYKQKLKRVLPHDKARNEEIINLLEEANAIFGAYDDKTRKPDVKVQKWQPQKAIILDLKKENSRLRDAFAKAVSGEEASRLQEIDTQISDIEKKQKTMNAWNENTDLKFRNSVEDPQPSTNAVMFCLMDVSGSMDEEKKNNAKIFYFLLYRFLKRNYDKTDIVFIRHHSVAQEVDEQEFFYGRETGGTVVSTALEKMHEVIRDRYPSTDWNIYGAQASDGDNDRSDNPKTKQLLTQTMDMVQAYFYTETPETAYGFNRKSDIWDIYSEVKEQNKGKFWMAQIKERNDVLKVFRDLFKKREAPISKMAALKY